VPRPLRRIEALPTTLDSRKRKMGQFQVGSWSTDWSPWLALARLRRASLDLSFDLQPNYAPEANAGGGVSRGAGGNGEEPGRVAKPARRRRSERA
jgi:hypothetical protein